MNTNKKDRRTGVTGILLFLIIGSLLFTILPVQAQNMSISSLNLMTQEDVLIYAANSTLIGTYNTSSVGIPLPSVDFMLVIKPTAVSRFFDPSTLLIDSFAWIETNFIALLVIGAMFGLARGRLW